MTGELSLIWTCRECGARFRVGRQAWPGGTRIRCPACARLSGPLPAVARGAARDPAAAGGGTARSSGPWSRLITALICCGVLAALLLTLGVQQVRSLLREEAPAPEATAPRPEVRPPTPDAQPAVAEAERQQLTERLAAAELYEAGRYREAAQLLQAYIAQHGDSEGAKLLSRALRRDGQLEAAGVAQRQYRTLRTEGRK